MYRGVTDLAFVGMLGIFLLADFRDIYSSTPQIVLFVDFINGCIISLPKVK